jgi:hypothetical protein
VKNYQQKIGGVTAAVDYVPFEEVFTLIHVSHVCATPVFWQSLCSMQFVALASAVFLHPVALYYAIPTLRKHVTHV